MKFKKLFAAVLVVTILPLSMFSCSKPAVPCDREYKITYSARMTDNDHVGNSWSKGLEHEGLSIRSGSVVVDDNELTVTVYAEERDSSTDYDESRVTFKNLAVGESETKKVYVYVTEDRGRYAGNTATWLFTITVQRTH